MVIVGIGVDLVDLARFERSAARTPALLARLFAHSELTRSTPDRAPTTRSLAGRFAAKEALIKALPDLPGFTWHDIRVVADAHGSPSFELSGATAATVRRHGAGAIHLSISHDAGAAIAFVVVEAGVAPVGGGSG